MFFYGKGGLNHYIATVRIGKSTCPSFSLTTMSRLQINS